MERPKQTPTAYGEAWGADAQSWISKELTTNRSPIVAPEPDEKLRSGSMASGTTLMSALPPWWISF
jgi:hypothetical protein